MAGSAQGACDKLAGVRAGRRHPAPGAGPRASVSGRPHARPAGTWPGGSWLTWP